MAPHVTIKRAGEKRYEVIPGRGFVLLAPAPFTRTYPTPDHIIEEARQHIWWMAIRQEPDCSLSLGYPDGSEVTYTVTDGVLSDGDGDGGVSFKGLLLVVEDHLWAMALHSSKEVVDA